MAAACLTDTKSINVEASKRNRKILFTTTLPGEIPREAIESQDARNVSGNCPRMSMRINQPVQTSVFFSKRSLAVVPGVCGKA
jgi:hypothetical protein